MLPRERIMDIARRVFRSYGFSPIDTPALEYLEILLGKGSDETDKQLYRFQDHGGRDVGLRFDLTVPLARFAAQHIGELGTPFKRYHIATVWRGENTQRGRYREFMQCDFDTIGTTLRRLPTSRPSWSSMICSRAIGFERLHDSRQPSRLCLVACLQKLGLAEKSIDVLRALDKLGKIGARSGRSRNCRRVAGARVTQATGRLLGLVRRSQAVERRLFSAELGNTRRRQRARRCGRRRLRENSRRCRAAACRHRAA